ncbi:MAG TPA: 16S rRNA (cytosine(1402)-N(4))-methyltransferase RsmH [Pirellulaceae bacterium]|nr:16S rRNA (cytosine(1402)-N(4))-methyltransferase RsmH [Pirellulaceae bacterium]
MPPLHVPVMVRKVLAALDPQPGQTLVDGTLGGGGHARLLAERIAPNGMLIALDRDPRAIAAAEQHLRGLPVKLAQANFCDLPSVLDELSVDRVDGILLDLGLSSDQLADQSRGFSFDATGELDLRFNTDEGEPAWRLLARLPEKQLADLIYKFGEERYSRRIARRIVDFRDAAPIHTAADLSALVRRCVPRSPKECIDPATRTFQALRIAVNRELESLELALERIPDRLTDGGHLVIISFHSLEDRLVKQAFRGDPRLEAVTKKPLVACDEEVQQNPRSRSAKLRAARRVPRL